MTGLCQKTALTLFERHFKRFTGLLDLLSDKARTELSEIEKDTNLEVKEMVEIEKSSVYLSHETEPEFERYMSVFK